MLFWFMKWFQCCWQLVLFMFLSSISNMSPKNYLLALMRNFSVSILPIPATKAVQLCSNDRTVINSRSSATLLTVHSGGSRTRLQCTNAGVTVGGWRIKRHWFVDLIWATETIVKAQLVPPSRRTTQLTAHQRRQFDAFSCRQHCARTGTALTVTAHSLLGTVTKALSINCEFASFVLLVTCTSTAVSHWFAVECLCNCIQYWLKVCIGNRNFCFPFFTRKSRANGNGDVNCYTGMGGNRKPIRADLEYWRCSNLNIFKLTKLRPMYSIIISTDLADTNNNEFFYFSSKNPCQLLLLSPDHKDTSSSPRGPYESVQQRAIGQAL